MNSLSQNITTTFDVIGMLHYDYIWSSVSFQINANILPQRIQLFQVRVAIIK